MANYDVLVIGASAGGLTPLKQLLKQLPANLNVSIFVVMHLTPHRRSFLPEIFSNLTQFKVVTATNNLKIKKKHIYFAPPNEHLLLKHGVIKLSQGPKVNHTRPAIDILFNSAALAYSSRVIGILLSGLLDDGTLGLQNIKSQGGICIVQDPKEAAQSDMPLNAIVNTKIDYVTTIDQMAKLIPKLSQRKVSKKINKNDLSLHLEEESQELKQTKEDLLNKIGKASIFTCPECNGTLWEISKNKQFHYRCRIGHAYSIKNLLTTHNSALENTLWAGIRALEENASLSYRIAKQLKFHKHHKAADFYVQKGKKEDMQARELRDMFFSESSLQKVTENGK